MRKSVVAWKNPDQFKKVYEWAYSDKLSKKQWAVDQMSLWETRCWPSLPTAVEATLLLVKSRIQDMLFEADKNFCKAQEVEMMYSTAIIRFVNLFLEMDRNTNTNTKGRISMVELAKKRNIPDWIIDVRHNTTHGFNPTLPVFRMTYKTIMEHLKEKFWMPEAVRICSIKKTIDENSILEIFQEYKAVQKQKVLDEYDREDAYKLSLEAVLKKINSLLSKLNSRKKFLEILVHPDYFITQDDVDILVKYDVSFIKNSMEILPQRAQQFWLPIIEILHTHDCIPTFLEMLLLSQKNRRIQIFQKVADALVLYILNLMIPRQESSKIGHHIFLQKGTLIEWERLLYSCVIGSSDFASYVFQRITSELKTNSWMEELTALLRFNQRLTLERVPNKGPKRKLDMTFTTEDLEKKLQKRRQNINGEFQENHWSMPLVNTDFSNQPLGHVFNPLNPIPKEEVTEVTESLSFEKKVPLYEGSEPITILKPATYIFKELPTDGFMLYISRN